MQARKKCSKTWTLEDEDDEDDEALANSEANAQNDIDPLDAYMQVPPSV